MTVVVATFGALSEVKLMHAIYHFKAQEVNNLILQTVRNSELKRRSCSHCKPITPSWRKHFAKCCEITLLLRSDFAAFLYSRVYFLLKLPDIYREREAWNLKVEGCCEVISQPFLSVCEISQTPFSLAKWFLEHPDICYRHWEIFYIRFLLSKSQNTPCKPPITRFLSF